MYLKSRQKDKISVFLYEPDEIKTVKKKNHCLLHTWRNRVLKVSVSNYVIIYHFSSSFKEALFNEWMN